MHPSKAGFLQKKKKQAIRRLSQSNNQVSPLAHGVKFTNIYRRGSQASRGQSSHSRGRGGKGRPPPSLGSTEDNPFLSTLPPSKAHAGDNTPGYVGEEVSVSQPTVSSNPFLSGLAKKHQQKQSQSGDNPSHHIPPLTQSLTDHSEPNSNEGNEPTTSKSLILSQSTSHLVNTKDPFNPFLEKSNPSTFQLPYSASGARTSHTTQGGSVSQAASSQTRSSGTHPLKQLRMPTYSEVAAAHSSRANVTRSSQIGVQKAPLPQHANLTTLHVKGIPGELNQSDILRNHFSKFGHVKLLKCFPAKMFATVEFSTRDGAVLAKKAGKVISPDCEPVSIFWHASKAATLEVPAAQSSRYRYTPTNSSNQEQSARLPMKQTSIENKEKGIEEVPSQRDDNSSKSTVWKCLGNPVGKPSVGKLPVTKPLARETKVKFSNKDKSWTPNEPVYSDDDEEEGDDSVSEGKYFLRELGNKLTGDEMDTIARTVTHPYYLRSLMQPDSIDGPTLSTQPYKDSDTFPLQRVLNSHQLYRVPTPDVSLLQPPRGIAVSDYYEALEARDQEIRKGIVKKTMLSEAVATVGTCPDMCPEKERYRREETRRLSWFEIQRNCGPGKPMVDHSKAIKEYSGSAADKEEPLPHDLRPLSILQMTMDYLVTRIMDNYEERKADWYDFVWNRTRGIRKDITLQHLCTVESTEMTEKCARFHILCSHLLCEEDIMTFDPNMNNENLNKCLLSLKEFYRDLKNEKAIQCPNEAEFCGYDILLHLTDGNVLNIVSQYSSSVRHSPEVVFAINTVLSFDSNNFVKFFKLVRVATFLNSCILHRYFDLVRIKAVKVLSRTHTRSKQGIDFPLSDLTRILAFENVKEAADFCQSKLNLVNNRQGTHVKFVRGSVQESEEPIGPRQSLNLVYSKNDKSLGEVVNGGPLPPLFTHTPFSSFSKDGKQLSELNPPPLSQVPLAPPPIQREPTYSIEDIEQATESVLIETVTAIIKETAQECVREEVQFVDETKELSYRSLCEELINGEVEKECPQIAQGTLLEAEQAKAVKDEIAEEVVTEVVESVVQKEVVEVLQSTYRECVLSAQAKDQAVNNIACCLVEDCLCECVESVVEETLQQIKKERKERLEVCRRLFLRRQTSKYWTRWYQVLKVREHVRQCASDIPPLPPLVTMAWQLDILCPSEKRRRLEVTSSDNTATKLEEGKKEREKRREEFFSPIDLPSLLRDSILALYRGSLAQHTPPHIYWKLNVIYPPRNHLSPADALNVDWLCRKLRYTTSEGSITSSAQPVAERASEILSFTLTSLHPDKIDEEKKHVWSGASNRQLGIVIRGLCPCQEFGGGDIMERNTSGALGILLYIATPQEKSADYSPYVHYVFEVLHVLIEDQRRLGTAPKLPLLLVCSKQLVDAHFAAWITVMRELDTYCKQPDSGLSEVRCLRLDIPSYIPKAVTEEEQLLCSDLQWLADHTHPPPVLDHVPVKDYIEQGILQHVLPQVVSDDSTRASALLPSQHPAPLISLYNAVIEHLADAASSSTLRTLNWPIPEFASEKFINGEPPPAYWNSSSYLHQLYSCIMSLRLPLPSQLPSNWRDLDWSGQCIHCMEYVKTVKLPVGDHHASVILMSRIKALLHQQTYSDLKETHRSVCSIPWAQVILACIETILTHLDSDLWASTFNDQSKFTVPTSWLRAQAETSLATASQLTHATPPTTSRKRHMRHRSDPHAVSVLSSHLLFNSFTSRQSLPMVSTPNAVGMASRPSLSLGVTPVQSGVDKADAERENFENVQSSLDREKVNSQRFEAQLLKWLSNPCPKENVPASSPPAAVVDGRKPRELFDVERVRPLETRLEKLQSQIRLAKWQDKEDDAYLRIVSRTV